MSIIGAVREYLSTFPFLSELSGGIQIDYTSGEPGSYGIVPTGEAALNWYGDGTIRKQYTFSLYAREFTQADLERLENCEFLERLSQWVEDNDQAGIYPVLPEGMDVESVSCANGVLFDYDPDLDQGCYQIQFEMIYERSR